MEQRTHIAGEFSLSDEEIRTLLTRIEKGDAPALMSLYDATNRLVFGQILRVLGDRSSAEETLLDVYTKAWKQSGAYDPAMSPIEWLMILAHRSAMARLHWAKRDNAKQETTHGIADSVATVAPKQQNSARSSLQAIASAQRELLEWAYFGGLSCSEMAAQVGKPVGAVKALIRAGLGKLGESLQTSRLSMEAGARDGGEQ